MSVCLLILLLGCSARSDFKKAIELDTVEAYEAFLEEHPDHETYAPRARKRMEALSFEEANAQGTYTAYRDFLKRFPYGAHARMADERAEEIRARELGIHLYRGQPQDFYAWVDRRRLPYRIRIRSLNPERETADHIERKWYLELVRRDLLVPMDPSKNHRVTPDLTLYVRETVLVLSTYPRALVEAEMRVKGKTVKRYRIVADHIEKYLLYEIFKDRDLYDALLRPSKEATREVSERFERVRARLPLRRSLSLELDMTRKISEPDQEMIRSLAAFLKSLPLAEDFIVYPRGHPPRGFSGQRLYLSVDPEIHSPRLRVGWGSPSLSIDWSRWNTRWILADRDYFFKKMTLDILDLLERWDTASIRSLPRRKPASHGRLTAPRQSPSA